MNKEKLLYEAPTALTFEVRCESAILTQSGDNQVFTLSGTYSGDYDDEED